MRDCVKTHEKAIEILTEKGATAFDAKGCRCKCGNTLCLYGYDNNLDCNCIGSVGVCPQCGNDDTFIDEIFERN